MKKRTLVVWLLVAALGVSPGFAQETDGRKIFEEHAIDVERGGNLTGKGHLTLEPALQYSHVESQFVDILGFTVLPALVVGVIQSEKIRRDSWIPSLTLRYGLIDDLEADLRIPYSFRKDQFAAGIGANQLEESVHDSGLGDIEGSFHYQVLREKGSRPALIAGLRIKSDTGDDSFGIPTQTIVQPSGQESVSLTVPREDLAHGSGFWAFEPSISLVKSSDPAALFFNLGYFWHLPEDKGAFGKVDPSDSINYSLGIAYALNEQLVLSTAFEQKFFDKTEIAGSDIPGTDLNLASLLLGGSYLLGENHSFSLTIGFGLTPDTPDVQVSIRIPIRIF